MKIALSKQQLAVIALIIANIIWGATSPIFKWSLQDSDPFTFGFFRFFIAALIILPFTIHKLKINADAFIKIFVISYLGLFLHITYLMFGLELSASINAPIIGTSAPIFIIFGSILFLKEKVKKKVIAGTLVSLTGVMLIILQPIFDAGFDGSLLGNFFFFLSMLTAVIYVLLLKRLKLPYSITTITFWLFAITTFTYLPFFLWESQGTNFLNEFTPQSLTGILFGGVFTSAIAYGCYNFAVKHMVTNETGIFFYMDPIVAVLVAMPLLGERVTLFYIIGSILVFIGIFIAEKRIHFHPVHKLR